MRLGEHRERDCLPAHLGSGGLLSFKDGNRGRESWTNCRDVLAAEGGELNARPDVRRQGRIGGEFGLECEAFTVVEFGGGIIVHQHVGGSQSLVAGGDHEGVVLPEGEGAIQHRTPQRDLFLKGGFTVQSVCLLPHLQNTFPVEQ